MSHIRRSGWEAGCDDIQDLQLDEQDPPVNYMAAERTLNIENSLSLDHRPFHRFLGLQLGQLRGIDAGVAARARSASGGARIVFVNDRFHCTRFRRRASR